MSVLVVAVSDPHSLAPEILAEAMAEARAKAGSGMTSALEGA